MTGFGQATPAELLRMAESVKNMLVARATGDTTEYSEYQDYRMELVTDPRTRDLLPRFVHTCRSMNEFWGHIKTMFPSYAERRQYLREEFNPLLTKLENWHTAPSDGETTFALEKFDSAHVTAAWHKALDRKIDEPDGAITMARTLLESVCKHILDDAGADYNHKSELKVLYNQVAKLLELSPGQHADDDIRQILSGCHTVVEGVGALRNRMSDAHGKGKRCANPEPRHAALAINLAGAVATFLIETWEQSSRKKLI